MESVKNSPPSATTMRNEQTSEVLSDGRLFGIAARR